MANDEDLERAKKLRPAERVRKLREFEEKKKKELEETEVLLRVAEEEEAAVQEKNRVLPIPQLAAADISLLMSETERIIFRQRRYKAEAMPENEVIELIEPDKVLEELAEEEARMAEPNTNQGAIYSSAFEEAKKPLYGPTETVTGFSRENEPRVKEFYDNIKGFYEMGTDNTSELYRKRTTTGIEEEQERKRNK